MLYYYTVSALLYTYSIYKAQLLYVCYVYIPQGIVRTMQQNWEVKDCMWRPSSTAQPLES